MSEPYYLRADSISAECRERVAAQVAAYHDSDRGWHHRMLLAYVDGLLSKDGGGAQLARFALNEFARLKAEGRK